MRKSKFTDDQIAFAIKQAKLGIPVAEVCRKMGISDGTFNKENRKLKQIVADLSLGKAMLQAVVAKKI